MEFQDYLVLDIISRKNPDRVLKRYFYDDREEAINSFERHKGRGDLVRVVLTSCQGIVLEDWKREDD